MDYYNQIKEELINNETYKRVKDFSKNKSDLKTYYNVGKILSDAGKHYGEGIIKEYSIKLTNELGKGYSVTNLKRMRQFYLYIEKGAPLGHQLTWSHYKYLLPIKDDTKRDYYINRCIKENLSKRELQKVIKEKEYERLPELTKEKIKKQQELSLIEEIKEPIIIKSKNNIDKDKIKEKILKQIILENIDDFLNQLGDGYSYIGNEYKIKVGNTYNYIDILLYNVIYHSYVVVELKVTSLKKEYIGQILLYRNYIDENIKNINDNKTIGLIIVKENNKYIIKYSTDDRIKAVEYILT